MRNSVLLLLMLSAPALAQPKFEVVSIKPNPGCRDNGSVISPGRLEWSCMTLERLIHNAYVTFADGKRLSIKEMEIVGAPNWASSDTYSIAAKADGGAALPLMAGPMLQAVLEDRFQLKIRRAAKETLVYALRPAKHGPKMAHTREGSCEMYDPQHSSTAGVGAGRPDVKICGNLLTKAAGSNLILEGYGVSGVNFAQSVSNYVDRPVVDQMGLAAPFDVHLEFARSEAAPGNANGPSIADALEQQLGLKLVATRAPLEYLIVEHVEKLGRSD